MTAAITTTSNSRPSAKNRVGVINQVDEKRVGGRDAAAWQPHWAFRDAGRGGAVGSRSYLQPEPMLQDATFAQAWAGAGLSSPVYAYGDNNPIGFTDPNGLYSVNTPPGKTCDLDVSRTMQSRVKTSANRITDDCLRKCVVERLDKMVFQCGTAEAKQKCDERPTTIARASLGKDCNNPAANAFWCNRSKGLNESCVVDALVHEAAHNCGWDHLQGKGVPGNEGHITTNCSDKAPGPTPVLPQ